MTLEHNAEARAAFERMHRDGRAGYRRALRDAGVELPSWAQDRRGKRNVEQSDVEHSHNVEQSNIAALSNIAEVESAEPLPDPTDEELGAALGFA
jgi:hypothetical protein